MRPDIRCDTGRDNRERPAGKGRVRSLFTTNGLVLVAGEITTGRYVDIPTIVRKTIRDIGYVSREIGFDYETCGVIVSIKEQSTDIAMGVDKSLETKGGEVIHEEPGRARGRGPGAYVRLCVKRNPGAHATSDNPGAEACANSLRKSGRTEHCHICGRTANRRSRWNMKAISR